MNIPQGTENSNLFLKSLSSNVWPLGPYQEIIFSSYNMFHLEKVRVGNDQEKAQSKRNSHFKNRVGKNQIDN